MVDMRSKNDGGMMLRPPATTTAAASPYSTLRSLRHQNIASMTPSAITAPRENEPNTISTCSANVAPRPRRSHGALVCIRR